jgi:hypothetical protein
MPAIPRYYGPHDQYLRERLAVCGGDYAAARQELKDELAQAGQKPNHGKTDFLEKVLELLNFEDPDFPRAKVSRLKRILGATGPEHHRRHYHGSGR